MTGDYRALVADDRVHGSLYVDPDVYADEMDRIFTRGWVFVGHDSEIPEVGQWVTRRIGLEPVIMVRDRSSQVHVLANRCAHRGTALCWEPCGRSSSFQCNYHAWTFGLDGSLKGVPYPGGFHGDKASLGLDRPAQVEEYRGFVFANQSGDAPPLSEHLGPNGFELIDRLCDLSPTGRIRVDGGWIGHRIASNWKMWNESDNDGYHLNWVHASMIKAAPDTYYQETMLGGEEGNRSFAVDHGRGHVELDQRPSYTRELAWLGTTREKVTKYCDDLVAARGAERAERLLWDGPPHAMIFPNLFLGELNLAIVEPFAPNETVHRHTAVLFDGVDDAFNRRLLRQSEAAMGPAGFIVADDAVTAERMQAGFAASRSEWSTSGGRGRAWIDLSRGLEREELGDDGRLRGRVSDETTNRGFWRQYRDVMAAN
jgi:phenylpropionate dioxygenase-like ring-hydroxylating dioxygenase large terminal subunit